MAVYDAQNKKNLDRLAAYARLAFIAAGDVVLIGGGHDAQLVARVKGSPVFQEGDLVKNPRGGGPAVDFIVDHGPSERYQFQDAIHRLGGYEKANISYTRP